MGADGEKINCSVSQW